MSFISGFYGFTINLSAPARDQYATLRFKLPLYIDEQPEELIAKVLVYCHAYESGLTFSDPSMYGKEPTIINRDIVGEISSWVEVGLPEEERLRRALRHSKEAKKSIYFRERAEANDFCFYLRGSTTNWVEQVNFYLLDPEFSAKIAETLTSSSRWDITFCDETVYCSIDGETFETTINQIDIWNLFQSTLTDEGE